MVLHHRSRPIIVPLKCPSCESKTVEKIPATSEQGAIILKGLARNQKVRLPELYLTQSYAPDLERHVFLMNCNTCGLVEAVDVKRRESLFKTRVRDSSEKLKSVLGTFVLAGMFLTLAVMAIFYLEIEGEIDIKILNFDGYTLELAVIVVIIVAAGLSFFIGASTGLVKLMKRFPRILEFTFKFHRLAVGDDKLYFFEHVTERENVGFKATLGRSFYGSILVLGIGILVLENFLIIPHLQEFFWVASYIIIAVLATSMPLIIMYLYVSPLLTKEINLYYSNKKNRVVKNVGEWLDTALQFFAAIDIILVSIIIIDSDLGSWILVIACLVLVVFAWFLIFTSIFNNYHHAEMKNLFKEHMREKYLLPVRHVQLVENYHYCQECGALVDVIHDDNCAKCKSPIVKCMICGDVMVSPGAKYDKDGGGVANMENKLLQLAKKVERKLDGIKETAAGLACPECGGLAHVDELYSWVAMRGTCPGCKEAIDLHGF